MEQFAEDAELLGQLREYLQEHGQSSSRPCVEGKEAEGAKFRDYFDFAEPITSMPSHRALALLRGRNEGMLNVSLMLDQELDADSLKPGPQPLRSSASPPASASRTRTARPTTGWSTRVRWTWKVKIFTAPRTRTDGRTARARRRTKPSASSARNLNDLLLAAPAGPRVTMGLDPGIRTGVQVAVVDDTGKVLDTPPSIRTSRATTGMARCTPWPAWPPSMA